MPFKPGSSTGGGSSGMTNPMTTGGDVIYGGASGVATRLANGTAGTYLKSNGTTLAPTWGTPTAMASNVYLTGNGANLVGWDATTYNAILFGNAGTKQVNVASTIDFYTTGSITLDPANGNVNIIGNGSNIPGMIRFHDNSASHVTTLQSADVCVSHTLKLPANNAAGVLTNDGSGNLSWV